MPPPEHTISFSRSTQRNGLFNPAATTFSLTRSQGGAPLGQLIVRFNKAEFRTPDGREDFAIRKSFWGSKWRYEGEDDRLFARISIGFRYTATFADDSRYRMKLRRRWRIFTRKAVDEFTHLALFFRDENEVMRLENFRPLPFFSSEVSATMEGVIHTQLSDIRTVAGLLLLFQTCLIVSRQAAAASA